LQQLAHKIPNVVSQQTNDPTKYKRNLLKVEIYFDNFNLVIVEETAAYPVSTFKSGTQHKSRYVVLFRVSLNDCVMNAL
jgi:hypothetical protein